MEVDATPQEDLAAVMSEIRQHYETVATKNRKELETWFQNKVSLDLQTPLRNHSISDLDLFLQMADLNKEVALGNETLQTSKSEVVEVRRTLQNLEIKLQAQISKVNPAHPDHLLHAPTT